jgi:hypothetical protein
MPIVKSIMHKFLLSLVMASIAILACLAQRPPTSGPNPSEPSGISPLLIIGGGAALGTASLLHLRSKRMTKLPLSERLPTYLLSRNYLPTTDALNLMYWLNPELDSNEHIKANKKLIMPSFPELAANPLDTISFLDELEVNIQSLNSKNSDLNTTYLSFSEKDSGGQFDYDVSNRVKVSMERLRKLDITNFLQNQSGNKVIQQLVFDLLHAYDDAMRSIAETGESTEPSVGLLEAIVDNLSEITSDLQSLSWNLKLAPDALHDPSKLLANASKISSFTGKHLPDAWKAKANPRLKGFAFAVFKRNDVGAVITKGPEVEGRYYVKYAAPALKNIPQAYHSLNGPATYATGFFPPAKLHIVVEDMNGGQVQLQNHLIDFRSVFVNPQYGRLEEFTIVPLFIPQ